MKLDFRFLLAASVIVAGLAQTHARAEDSLSDLFDKINPSVLTLSVYDRNGRQISHGSGFVVDRKGIVATSLHVIEDGAAVKLTSSTDDEFVARGVLIKNQEWDVALLRTEKLPLQALPLAPAGTAKVGMDVIAIGSPLGFSNSISQGIISGLRRPTPTSSDQDLLQITSAVSPGSSGGPILTTDGQVVGIAAATTPGAQNLNFAVPSRVVLELLEEAEHSEMQLALLDPNTLEPIRPLIEQECAEEDIVMFEQVLSRAIRIGAPAYNAENFEACYRLYEGAAYKVLYTLSQRCPTAHSVLELALSQSQATRVNGRYPTIPANQAWIMRRAFDSILPVPPQMRGPLENEPPGKGY